MTGGVALLAIGDELLSGIRADTNCAWLASRMHDAGVPVLTIQVLPDEDGPILAALEQWIGKVGMIVLSGGLGPTHDDRTRAVMARHLGVGLKRDDEAYDRIVARYAEPLRSRIEASRDKQSLIPEGARSIFNPQGSALGISFSERGTEVYALPGVPWEFRAMAEESVLEGIRAASAWKQVVVAGWPESLLAEKFKDTLEDPGLHVSILPSAGIVTLVFRGEPDRVEAAVSLVKKNLPLDCLGDGEQDMATALVNRAAAAGLSFSCAESCTGGLVGGAITGVPGSSRVFLGSAVCYSNGAKAALLGVDPEVIAIHGAVSGECALQMARGARRAFGSDLAVSVTGIAGPEGGTEGKPVGTVWFGFSGPSGDGAFLRNLSGDRVHIRRWSTAIALETLWRRLEEV
jgi:nicotinamide-nucleotide amidase